MDMHVSPAGPGTYAMVYSSTATFEGRLVGGTEAIFSPTQRVGSSAHLWF